MTYEEAEANIGNVVVYEDHGKREDGTLVRLGSRGNVFVRYSHNDSSIQSTPLDRLTLFSMSM